MNALLKVLIVLGAIGVGIGSRIYFHQADNPVEQVAEEVIRETVGVDVDLSPDYPAQYDMVITSPSS